MVWQLFLFQLSMCGCWSHSHQTVQKEKDSQRLKHLLRHLLAKDRHALLWWSLFTSRVLHRLPRECNWFQSHRAFRSTQTGVHGESRSHRLCCHRSLSRGNLPASAVHPAIPCPGGSMKTCQCIRQRNTEYHQHSPPALPGWNALPSGRPSATFFLTANPQTTLFLAANLVCSWCPTDQDGLQWRKRDGFRKNPTFANCTCPRHFW